MNTAIELSAKERAEQALDAAQITMLAKFIPFSQSRNKGEKNPSLNWRVTIAVKGRDVLQIDYMQGSGHCPSYKAKLAPYDKQRAIAHECETGKTGRYLESIGYMSSAKPIPRPEPVDVIYSLITDSDALEYSGYEDWCGNFGYDPDSRTGEATYRACLEIGLKLHAALGDAGLSALRTTYEGY